MGAERRRRLHPDTTAWLVVEVAAAHQWPSEGTVPRQPTTLEKYIRH